jgi:hypothetical protein
MGSFFDTFPKVRYDINRRKLSNFDTITNITFRVGIIKSVLNNTSSYFKYTVTDQDRPEILADKIYGNPEAYWIILYANDMYDPQYDWPLNYLNFNGYIVSKYGSAEWAKTNIHHYEKVIERTVGDTTTVTRLEINGERLTDNQLEVPYDTYDTLADEQSVSTYELNGKTITEVIYRNAVSYFDYEDQKNEEKRSIRIVKKEYYPQIIREFNDLTNFTGNNNLRKLFKP